MPPGAVGSPDYQNHYNALTAACQQPPPPSVSPAAGDPMGYVGGGAARVVYRGTDNHVHELALTDQWYHFDMTGVPGAVPAAGDPMGYVDAGGTARVVYRGTDNHVHELALTDRLRESGGARLLHSEARRGRGMNDGVPSFRDNVWCERLATTPPRHVVVVRGPGNRIDPSATSTPTTPATPIRQRRRAAAQPLGMTRRRSGIIVGIPPIATPRDRW
jgi:hypothetical protein